MAFSQVFTFLDGISKISKFVGEGLTLACTRKSDQLKQNLAVEERILDVKTFQQFSDSRGILDVGENLCLTHLNHCIRAAKVQPARVLCCISFIRKDCCRYNKDQWCNETHAQHLPAM